MKKIFSLLIALCMITGLSGVALAGNVNQYFGYGSNVTFTDVPDNYWAKDQIEYFAEQGIVEGYEDGRFKPNNGVTREEFCKLLVTTFNASVETPRSASFTDVDKNRWSYPFVETCKDFLTGYTNPFGGLPSFHPSEYATREDIAVALVRMMGYTDGDAKDKKYATRKFSDGNSISPGLVPYVSIACEKGLISGYPDGSFRPSKGITRAETVVLLNRATKQAVTNINSDIELSATTKYSSDYKTVTIYITAEEDTAVTVDKKTVKMSKSYYDDTYSGTYTYTFDKKGSKHFVVEGKKSGKTKTIEVFAEYEANGPEIEITECPETATSDEVRISGTIKGADYSSVKLTVNGKAVSVGYSGSWYTRLELVKGDNDIVIVAENENGEKTTIKKVIEFSPEAPVIEFYDCPEYSVEKNVELSGYVKDNYGVKSFTVNGKEIEFDSGWSSRCSWEFKYELKEGKNTLEFVATSTSGAKTKIVKEIVLNENAPEIKFYSIPEETEDATLSISGYVSNDSDSGWMLRINDEIVKVSYSSWSHTLQLKPGKNDIVIEAINDLGKSTTVKKSVKFNPPAPVLKVTEWPTSTTSTYATIKGTATDENTASRNLKLTVDGESVPMGGRYNYGSEWETTVSLKAGNNAIVIEVTNEYGVKTKKTIDIKCEVSKPSLLITQWPKTTEENVVTISGEVSDEEDSLPTVEVNGRTAKVYYDGTWKAEVRLTEGVNKITVEATNKFGMSEQKTIKIELVVPEEEPEEEPEEKPVEKDEEPESTDEDADVKTEKDEEDTESDTDSSTED